MKNKVLRYLLSFVYPVHCPSCGCLINHRLNICDRCKSELAPYIEDEYNNFGERNGAYFCCVYDGAAKKIVHNLKFGNDIIAAYAMAEEMAHKLRLCGIAERLDVIVPVPMTRKRKAARGYNQCVWLAREIGHIIGKPCDMHAFVKVRETSQQKSLHYEERLKNLNSCFSVKHSERLAGKRVLVVDDLSTTGATLREAVETLKDSGVAEVYAIAFAHTIKKYEDC